MRPRATFFSNASGREIPVQAPAGQQRRNPCGGHQRRLLLGAAVLRAVAGPLERRHVMERPVGSGVVVVDRGVILTVCASCLAPAVAIETASAAAGRPPF